MPLIFKLTAALLLLFITGSAVFGQQPFTTDDADTTPKHHFHFEFSDEFDVLQPSSFPNLKQNTADFELDYGVLDNLEVGIEVPLLTVFNASGTVPFRPRGIGDANLSVKYNFLKEREHSRRPALALAFNIELPTGDAKRQLGSGLADFYGNGVIQKSLTRKTTLRLNGGILFSGNESTGVIGIKTRGTVFTGGGSLVKQFTPKLDLGFEVTGAVTKNFQLGKGQLQTQVGGNYIVKRNMTFDFGVVVGKFDASPRAGLQLGFSMDF
ncbi:MAG: transporter [bacterium]